MEKSIAKFLCKYVKCIKIPENRDDYILNKIYKVKCEGESPYVPREKEYENEIEWGIRLSYAVDCFEPIFIDNSNIINCEGK